MKPSQLNECESGKAVHKGHEARAIVVAYSFCGIKSTADPCTLCGGWHVRKEGEE